MTPIHRGLDDASKQIFLMASGVVKTGFQVALIGRLADAFKVATTS